MAVSSRRRTCLTLASGLRLFASINHTSEIFVSCVWCVSCVFSSVSFVFVLLFSHTPESRTSARATPEAPLPLTPCRECRGAHLSSHRSCLDFEFELVLCSGRPMSRFDGANQRGRLTQIWPSPCVGSPVCFLASRFRAHVPTLHRLVLFGFFHCRFCCPAALPSVTEHTGEVRFGSSSRLSWRPSTRGLCRALVRRFCALSR